MKTTLALALLAASPLALAAERTVTTGPFAPGETIAPLAADAPPHDSRAFVKTVVPVSGKAALEIPATGSGSLLVWTLPVRAGKGAGVAAQAAPSGGAAVDSTLRAPSGATLERGQERARGAALRRFAIEDFGGEDLGLPSVPGKNEVLHVADSEAGRYQLELVARGDEAAFTVVVAEPESPLVLTSWTGPLSRQPGEPVTVHARLRDGDGAVAGAAVTARLAPEGGAALSGVALLDDGEHGDGAAGDGHYAATVADLPEAPGAWTVRVEAEGQDRDGRAFARTGSSGFVSERGAARLLAGSVAARRDGGDLVVTATARVREAGTYRLDVLVGASASADGSRPGVAWGELTQELAAGTADLALRIPAAELAGAAGPLAAEVRLLGLSPMGVAGRALVDVAP